MHFHFHISCLFQPGVRETRRRLAQVQLHLEVKERSHLCSGHPNLAINIFHIRNTIIFECMSLSFLYFVSKSTRNKDKRHSPVKSGILFFTFDPTISSLGRGADFLDFWTKKFTFKQFPDTFRGPS